MSRPTTTFLDSFLASSFGETASLVDITLTNSIVKRFATIPITLSGNFYTQYLLEVGEIEEVDGSQVDKVSLEISNVDKQIGLDILAGLYTLADCSVKRLCRHADGSFEVVELFWGKVIPIETTESQVTLEVIDAIVAAKYVTVWTLATECENTFKDAVCGYTGSETFCNKNLRGDCTKYNNTHRFRGVPIIEQVPETTPPSEPPLIDDGGNNGGGGLGNGGWGGDNLTRDGYYIA
jgi:hypothetical protein